MNGKMAEKAGLERDYSDGKPPRLRSKGFSDRERKAILAAALAHKPGKEHPRTGAAKAWVPWLCAFTGARVGEIGQLRKQT
jgi:integrase